MSFINDKSLTNLVRRHDRRKGFSLIEALFASVLVSLGIVAVVGASLSNAKVNNDAIDLNRAVILAQNAREYSMNQAFDSVVTQTFTTCVDGTGTAISDCSGWSQKFTVSYVDPTDITSTSFIATDVKKVSLEILSGQNTVLSDSWLVAKRHDE